MKEEAESRKMCCCSLQRQVQVSAAVNILLLVISATLQLVQHDIEIPGWMIAVISVVYLILLAIYALFLYGSKNRNRWMLIPFMVVKSIQIIGTIGFGIYLLTGMEGVFITILLALIVSLGLDVYFLQVAVRFYKEITRVNQETGQPCTE